MSDRMIPLSFDAIMRRALFEYAENGSVFGVHKIWRGNSAELNIFEQPLALPLGVAAGPHTQLAQNIIAAFICGARFFELKTVQTLDGENLPVAKPCILAADEGYNVEWSTELYVPQALCEYIKAWFAIKLLAKELETSDENAFVFNMSVGYDLEGIQSEKLDNFIEGLKNAQHEKQFIACREWALENVSLFKNVDKNYIDKISPKICCSATLSTLHGCPPDEIERIANYLITQKQLNTYIKCNPTLLGYEKARKILDALGYDYIRFDDHHFKADLQLAHAVPMLRRLMAIAEKRNLEFGVKLTNTFPVDIAQNELEGTEMYMSGRSLFPLSVRVARLLCDEFGGKIRISYSGGADETNIAQLYAAGIWPITVATTLLKPLGYNRLYHLAKELSGVCTPCLTAINGENLSVICADSAKNEHYKKPIKEAKTRKKGNVPLMNCSKAACSGGCPFGQDIPAYLRLVKKGDYENALSVILEKNPLPFITGNICAHNCQSACTRAFVDGAIEIRAAKKRAAENAFNTVLPQIKPEEKNKKRLAVIGGGPAGMAAAYFMAKNGWSVELFEKTEALGGIVRHIIPRFRITQDAIDADAMLLQAVRVKINLNTEITSPAQLKGFDAIIAAIGAWKKNDEILNGGSSVDALKFLRLCEENGYSLQLGAEVAVIGGGNTAMDAARAAKRVKGVKKVRLIYRRTKRYMPADEEELKLAISEGIEFYELLAPISLENSVLTCEKMALASADKSGRRSVIPTGKTIALRADTVVAAVGQKIDTTLYRALGVNILNNKPEINPLTRESNIKGIYIAGDGAFGAASVADAIADAAAIAKALGVSFERFEAENAKASRKGAIAERCNAHECMECAAVCENCVDVCPNRANISIYVSELGTSQIIHIDDMCNECGNCTAFCPYEQSPYKSKFTLFRSKETFDESKNDGFLALSEGVAYIRLSGAVKQYKIDESGFLYEPLRLFINACLKELSMF